MIRQFKPVRFFVLIGLAAFIVCGEKAGEQAPPGATLPTETDVNTTAQKYFEQQGPAEQLQNPSRAADLQAFKQAFEKGYTAGFKKTHPQQ